MFFRKTLPVNILLVEDDDIDLEVVTRAFRKRRIANNLFVARDGIEALDLLRSGKIASPVMILLDINLPRMDGLEFLKAIRTDPQHYHHTVFVLTTSANQVDLYKAYDLNVAGYMVKSDVGEGFVEAVQQIEAYWRFVEVEDKPAEA